MTLERAGEYRITVRPNDEPRKGEWFWLLEAFDEEGVCDYVAQGLSDNRNYAFEHAREAARRHAAHPPETEVFNV
jgi:hypothetical protein